MFLAQEGRRQARELLHVHQVTGFRFPFQVFLASIITPTTTALTLELAHLSALMSLQASSALYGHKCIDSYAGPRFQQVLKNAQLVKTAAGVVSAFPDCMLYICHT